MNPAMQLPEACLCNENITGGLKTIRELITFMFTCRRCEDAPCIAVCPADALEKGADGIISRHTNLCISCKSCVTICPFGTIMSDFFRHHINKSLYYDLNDNTEMKKFIELSPEGTVTLTETDESPEEHIFRLSEKVLVKEYMYITEKE